MLWSGLLLALWALLLFLSCLLEEVWWPLFNVFFLALGILPYVFGSHQSNGLWGAIGDFSTGAVLVSMLAFPVVLHNAYVIGPEALAAISISTFALFASVSILLSSVSL